MSTATAAIRRARVDAAASLQNPRLALEHWLAGIALAQHGLPADAIVVVRQLRATPAALAGRAADPLSAALREAVRPARLAFVGAGAAAVWFENEAELLACLARDQLDGSAASRWWWPLLLGATPALPLALQRWTAQPRCVPHALADLANTGPAVAWLEQLGAGGRGALLAALTQVFPIASAWAQALAAAEHAPAPLGRVTPVRSRDGAARLQASIAPRTARPVDPVRLLLRLCALLRDAPHRAADAQGVAQWAAAEPASAVAPPASREPLPHEPLPPFVLAGPPPLAAWRAAGIAYRQPAPVRPDAAAQIEAPEPQRARSSAAAPGAAARERGAAQPARTLPRLATRALPSFDTPFAGLAFLLNTLVALGLVGDFTQPRHPGLPMSPWRVLHAAGRACFGHRFTTDTFARWLDERAGLPRSAPVAPPWQLDAIALQAFAADTRPWHAVTAPDALTLWHPAGFIVARLAPGSDVQALAPHGLVPHRTPQPAAPGRGLAGLLWPLLRARIALALGLPDGRAAAHLAFALPGRVQARAERLDIRFDLAALPLCVRLAGLDRDPGWIPAAGCDVRFHFD